MVVPVVEAVVVATAVAVTAVAVTGVTVPAATAFLLVRPLAPHQAPHQHQDQAVDLEVQALALPACKADGTRLL